MVGSKHRDYLTTVDGKQRIFRPVEKYYDVLEFQRYNYTENEIEKVSNLIRDELTGDLISKDIKDKYPPDHPRWKYPFFGYCVPATFVMLYLMNTAVLEPMRGEDSGGEGHWWLRDKLTREKYDLTSDQFSTPGELEAVYATGHPKGYYGLKEAPASQFFELIQKVQPASKRFKASDPHESLGSLGFL